MTQNLNIDDLIRTLNKLLHNNGFNFVVHFSSHNLDRTIYTLLVDTCWTPRIQKRLKYDVKKDSITVIGNTHRIVLMSDPDLSKKLGYAISGVVYIS